MFTKDVLETDDASYFCDWLCEVTGTTRDEWMGFPTEKLRSLSREFMRQQRAMEVTEVLAR